MKKQKTDDIQIKPYRYRDDIIGRFFRFITLLYNSTATIISLVFLAVMLILGKGNKWIYTAQIVFSVLNMLVVLLSVFVFYSKSSKRALKFVKSGISVMRLTVTAVNMILTVTMWFTAYAQSAFMTVTLVVYTIFYALALVVQLFVLVIKILILTKRKKNMPPPSLPPSGYSL